jgi:CRP/FNR family transcriptional regulator, nitrogen fixation regulation protein
MHIQTARHETQTRHIAARDARNAPPAFHALFASIELCGAPMHFDRNAEIYGEEESADYVYTVLQGAVRTYKVLSDGRRQINAFHLSGDIFGLEIGDEHSCSAEAVSDVQVLVVKRSLVMSVADRSNDVAHRLWSMTAGELRRSQNHSLLLIKSARERVAAFLLDMAERLFTDGAVELPMSRQDIADYLGLTIETVSRTLSQFEGAATIELPASRRIVLRNRSALSRLNS